MKHLPTLLLLCAAFAALAPTPGAARPVPPETAAPQTGSQPPQTVQAPQTMQAPQTVPAAAPAGTDPAEEVALLKTQSTARERILARLPRISGYVQAGYEGSERASDFFLKRVRLNLAGDLAPKLDYRIQIEFCGPKLVDAYLRYRPRHWLHLRLGEYKLPFSIENTEYPPLKYELIDYPLSLRKLMGFSDLCGLSATGRDLGAMLSGSIFPRGDAGVLSYDIGVFNGEGLNTRDRNKSKDLCARLIVRPVRGLQIAGSWYRGEYGADHRKRIRYGAGACYDRGEVVLRGEWIRGTTGMPAADGSGIRDLDSEGWYAVAGWRVTKSLTPVVRYDTFREDLSSPDSRQTDYTAGLTWQPVKFLRCQLDYTFERYAARDAANRHVIALLLTGIF